MTEAEALRIVNIRLHALVRAVGGLGFTAFEAEQAFGAFGEMLQTSDALLGFAEIREQRRAERIALAAAVLILLIGVAAWLGLA